MREGFCFAPAGVKFPDADFLLPWGSESTSLQGEGQQAGVRRVCPLSLSLHQSGTEAEAGQMDSEHILYLYFVSLRR